MIPIFSLGKKGSTNESFVASYFGTVKEWKFSTDLEIYTREVVKKEIGR